MLQSEKELRELLVETRDTLQNLIAWYNKESLIRGNETVAKVDKALSEKE